jgi:hypothetical protein
MEMSEREASLRRARQQASMADGVSWGMGEDAIEEEEDDVEEITWQTYSGELTPKQEKTKEKVLKRLEKVSIFVPNHFFSMQNHIFSWYFLVT